MAWQTIDEEIANCVRDITDFDPENPLHAIGGNPVHKLLDIETNHPRDFNAANRARITIFLRNYRDTVGDPDLVEVIDEYLSPGNRGNWSMLAAA